MTAVVSTAGPARIEIVGVAGTGKSTLAAGLCAEAGWLPADDLDTRRPAQLPDVAAGGAMLAPALVSAARLGTRPSWRQFKDAVYVASWDRHLARRPAPTDAVLLLDQGPVFALSRLRWEMPQWTRTPAFDRWWHRAVTQWRHGLDAVVFLDADDDVLMARIAAREQPHTVRTAAVSTAQQFLQSSRRALYATVTELCAGGPSPRLLHVDTTDASADDVLDAVQSWTRHGRRPA